MTQLLVRKFLVGFDNPLLIEVFYDKSFWILTFSTLCIASAGYIINDYFDVKIDLINKPNQVYIGRTIKRRYALIFHQLLSGFGILLGLFLGLKILLVNLGITVLLWFYASVLKKKPLVGNLIIAFMTGMAIFEFEIYYQKNEVLILIYAVFAFFINLIREIIKDVEDISGDKLHGAKTLPILIGIRKTKYVVYSIGVLFAITVITASAFLNNQKLWIMFSFLSLMFLYFVYKLIKADRKIHFTELSSICKYILIFGVISMILI